MRYFVIITAICLNYNAILDYYIYSMFFYKWKSESDVYRRQILTTKVDPRAVRVKYRKIEILQEQQGCFLFYYDHIMNIYCW